MLWVYWSGNDVFVDLKSVDQVDFGKFRWELVLCCGVPCESTAIGGNNEVLVLAVLLGLLKDLGGSLEVREGLVNEAGSLI
jgi:hypothetical protein